MNLFKNLYYFFITNKFFNCYNKIILYKINNIKFIEINIENLFNVISFKIFYLKNTIFLLI